MEGRGRMARGGGAPRRDGGGPRGAAGGGGGGGGGGSGPGTAERGAGGCAAPGSSGGLLGRRGRLREAHRAGWARPVRTCLHHAVRGSPRERGTRSRGQ